MVQLATRTLQAFEDAVAADQGNTFRMWLGRVIPHIGDAYRCDEGGFRSHMGASGIGRDCARAIWYSFRWAAETRAQGRMVRLWNRGHLEEARFIALLLTIGCTVIQQDENGNQFRISDFGGHYGGAGDGMCDGIPDLPPGTRALTEFKTHNDKSFKKLKDEGLRVSKFQHYVQMQQYMSKMGLAVGVYFAVNKNDDEIYAEIVHLDIENAQRFTYRAISIIPVNEAPKRINESAGWFDCKFCDFRPQCHLGAPPAVNCRTCVHSQAHEDGTWRCHVPTQPIGEGADVILSKQMQLAACSMWAKNPTAFK